MHQIARSAYYNPGSGCHESQIGRYMVSRADTKRLTAREVLAERGDRYSRGVSATVIFSRSVSGIFRAVRGRGPLRMHNTPSCIIDR